MVMSCELDCVNPVKTHWDCDLNKKTCLGRIAEYSTKGALLLQFCFLFKEKGRMTGRVQHSNAAGRIEEVLWRGRSHELLAYILK
jgi:hypothetical protein